MMAWLWRGSFYNTGHSWSKQVLARRWWPLFLSHHVQEKTKGKQCTGIKFIHPSCPSDRFYHWTKVPRVTKRRLFQFIRNLDLRNRDSITLREAKVNFSTTVKSKKVKIPAVNGIGNRVLQFWGYAWPCKPPTIPRCTSRYEIYSNIDGGGGIIR